MIKKLSIATIVLAFLGLLDAAYLTITHYKDLTVPCSLAHGCETVLTSKYATVGSVPIALIGAGFYLVVMILTGLFLQGQRKLSGIPTTMLLFILTGAGVIVGVTLILVQALLLHAFCQYCLASEAIDVLLFARVFSLKKLSTKE